MVRLFLLSTGFFIFSGLLAGEGGLHAEVSSQKATARLIAAGDLRAGVYHAGVQINLAPSAITYWRNPGETGVPPDFDFARSDNARISVAMPAPQRIKEAEGDVFGYHTRVIFPLTITPADPAQPVKIKLKFSYALCEKICVPMQENLALTLAPGAPAGPDAALLAQAQALLPKPAELAQTGSLAEVPAQNAGAKRIWIFTPKADDALDLFAEAPEGYFVETFGTTGKGFRIVLAEQSAPTKDPKPVPLRLTLVTKTGAVEFAASLNGANQ